MSMCDLSAIIRRISSPLDPQPTGTEPRLPRLEGIRAVVFDVYGTLLVSGSGDISLTSGAARGDAAIDALCTAAQEPKASAPGVFSGTTPGADASDSWVSGDQLVEQLHNAIRAEHAASDAEFPEVDIREVWQSVLNQYDDLLNAQDTSRLAIEYECRVNPVWPMPGCGVMLAALRDAKRTLGIVSNAQFFTPITIESLLGDSMVDLGFEPRRCIWSFEHWQAKPGRFLYERMAEALAADGIAPAEALYVGNDMRNDIAPAAAVGFRTALFAGDARSLRLREGDPLVAGVEPDAVVTDLPQLLSILSLADR